MPSNDDGEAYDLKIMAAVSLSRWRGVRDFFFLLYCSLSNERYLPEPYSFWGKYVPHQQPQGMRDKLHRCNRACERCAWKNNTENTPEEKDVLMRSFYKLGIWKDTKKTKKCWATMIIWRRREMRIELVKISSSSSISDHFRKFYNNRYWSLKNLQKYSCCLVDIYYWFETRVCIR